ncbi:MAG TPA: hypothetical protein PLK63_02185, partial [Catalimonadaceae bacterium]|nr:hypothetical protein [Catalimonadaceae bacterium]
MKTLYALLFFIFLSLGAYSQPKLFTGEFDNQSGTGGSKDYSTGWTFEGSAFSSYRFIASVPSTGDSYFRFRNNANTTDREPSGADGTSIPTNQTSAFTAVQDGNTKAFKVAGAVTGYRYVFKVDAAISNIAIFEIQGTNVRTVSTVAKTTPAATVYPGQDVLITATLSGAFDAG